MPLPLALTLALPLPILPCTSTLVEIVVRLVAGVVGSCSGSGVSSTSKDRNVMTNARAKKDGGVGARATPPSLSKLCFCCTENFIQRWGTHYIKSAKFGGELEIRKTKQADQDETKTDFAKTMEMEYKSLFASVGGKYSKKEGYQQREQTKTTSTSLKVQGGSQEIASILSDAYSPTFKNEFKEWLQSIPKYPKAFKFLMGSISDLVNFRAHDLFPEEKVCNSVFLKPIFFHG